MCQRLTKLNSNVLRERAEQQRSLNELRENLDGHTLTFRDGPTGKKRRTLFRLEPLRGVPVGAVPFGRVFRALFLVLTIWRIWHPQGAESGPAGGLRGSRRWASPLLVV